MYLYLMHSWDQIGVLTPYDFIITIAQSHTHCLSNVYFAPVKWPMYLYLMHSWDQTGVLTPNDFIITIAQSHTHCLRQCLLCAFCSTTMFTLCSVCLLCFPLYVHQQDKVHYFLLASTVYWLILCYHGDGHLYEILGSILNEPALNARRQHSFTSTEILITHF